MCQGLGDVGGLLVRISHIAIVTLVRGSTVIDGVYLPVGSSLHACEGFRLDCARFARDALQPRRGGGRGCRLAWGGRGFGVVVLWHAPSPWWPRAGCHAARGALVYFLHWWAESEGVAGRRQRDATATTALLGARSRTADCRQSAQSPHEATPVSRKPPSLNHTRSRTIKTQQPISIASPPPHHQQPSHPPLTPFRSPALRRARPALPGSAPRSAWQ